MKSLFALLLIGTALGLYAAPRRLDSWSLPKCFDDPKYKDRNGWCDCHEDNDGVYQCWWWEFIRQRRSQSFDCETDPDCKLKVKCWTDGCEDIPQYEKRGKTSKDFEKDKTEEVTVNDDEDRRRLVRTPVVY